MSRSLPPIADWRGRDLTVGDRVIFTRGASRRGFAVGTIVGFADHNGTDWRPYAYVEIEESTSSYRKIRDAPSKVLIANLTQFNPSAEEEGRYT